MQEIFLFVQNNILAVVAAVFTLVFIIYSLLERDHSIKLTKKYRSAIFETQSKIFLSATQYLISGNKDLAIKEFLNAVDLNRETIDTYFALGGLFRSNGEIEKAISIHRSLIARDNISESTRLKALKELALDFDKGGFVDKALETYKDVLKINRDQFEVIQAICRIYEDIGDWDQAYNYRIMLSKVGHENQSQTISHILVEKAKHLFDEGKIGECQEDLEDALRFSPSVSAKILQLKIYIVQGNLEEADALLGEIIKEHPMFVSFVFISLEETNIKDKKVATEYHERLEHLKKSFLSIEGKDVINSQALVLSKIRILNANQEHQKAYDVLKEWIHGKGPQSDALKIEYIKLLIALNKADEAIKETQSFLSNINESLTRHYCSQCGFNSDEIFWRCPQCHEWETIQFRMKV